MTFNIPVHVESIIERLEKKGYEAYVVGGSVRDLILGRIPKDYDITTNAYPEEIESVFNDLKTVDIGKKFGTIIVCQPEGDVEVTTFRREGPYVDGRRPEWVSFSTSIEDDLSRRDFTINAIAYNRKRGIVDPYEGQKDLERKLIRAVGNPEERFSEDYLRILRAVRFSSELEFSIENDTLMAAKKLSKDILKVSMERIVDELFKIILTRVPSRGVRLLEETGLLEMILPEIMPAIGFEQKNPHHERDVYNHILCVIDNTPPVLEVRLAALFHDIGKPHTLKVDEEGVGHFYGHDRIGANIAKDVLKRYKVSNDLQEKVFRLVIEHMNHHANFKEKGLKRLIRRVGEDNIFNLFALQKADIKCSNRNANFDHILEREKKVEDILKNREPYKLSHMNIKGDDLIALGFKEGAIIGEILECLLEKVIENPKYNDRETLKEIALKKYSKKISKNYT